MNKGYVVRGKCDGHEVRPHRDDGAFSPALTSAPGFREHVFEIASGAAGALAHMVKCGCTDVTIFAVTEAGETPLLSYEAALARVDVLQKRERRMFDGFRAEIDRIQEALGIGPTRSVLWCVAEIGRLRSEAAVSHLAALRAAEERLLDAHGWKPGDPGFWIDPTDGTQWPREGAIAAVRRRPEPGAKDGNKQ